MKKFVVIFLATALSATMAMAEEPLAIAKLIEDINTAARTNKQRMLSIITINTDVSTSTLEQEKERTGLSFGDIYVAHSLSLATKKKFSAIVALKKSGQSWAQIAKFAQSLTERIQRPDQGDAEAVTASQTETVMKVIPSPAEGEGPRRR